MRSLSSSRVLFLSFHLLACGDDGANGAGGNPTLVRVDNAAPADCAAGGLVVKVGQDANGNGVLDDAEVESTNVVCNGAEGNPGQQGQDGTPNSLACLTTPGKDCSDANLVGAVLTEDMIGANLAGADLRYALFDEVSLAGANLQGANLSGALFTYSSLAGANLRDVVAIGARFYGVSFNGARFDGANLDSAVMVSLGRGYAYDTVFDGATLRNARITVNTNLDRPSSFTGANLSGAWLVNSSLGNVSLVNANLAGAAVYYLSNSNLAGANLSGATLVDANLSSTQVDDNTNFDGVFFSAATLFPNGTSPGADAINLSESDLGGANLSGLWILRNISDANLIGANLSGVRLGYTSATLYNVNLVGANLANLPMHVSYSEQGNAYLNLDTSNAAGANFAGVDASFAAITNTDAFGAIFDGATLAEVNAAASNFTNASFVGAAMVRGFFSAANFANANLTGATLSGSYTNDVDFTGTVFSDTYYNTIGNFTAAGNAGTVNVADVGVLPANFGVGLRHPFLRTSGANLSGFSFAGANLFNASFDGSRGSANFAASQLQHAWFVNANLNDSSFVGANLHHATLYNASFVGANFTNADLSNADMGPTESACCTGIVPPRFDDAIFSNTICPNGVPSDLRPSGSCVGAYYIQPVL